MKKIILFLTFMFLTLNVGFANSFASKEVFIGNFNAIKIELPSIVRFEYNKECSVEINSKYDYLYKMSIIGDTLIILPYYRNIDLSEIHHEDIFITVKHPQHKKMINSLEIKKQLRKTKTEILKK